MKKLDKYQMEVVTTNENILVIAGPGSGKTTTIIEKVNYLLSFNDSNDILMISFTNKSVEDIKSRLNGDIKVLTFHKLAIDILKYNHINFSICSEVLLDYIINEYFKLFSQKDKKRLCNYLNILDFNNQEFTNLKKLIKTFINLFKTNNRDINILKKIITSYKDKYLIKIIFDILKLYEEEKNSTNTYDFDDLIIKATTLLKRKYNYYKYKYIIIDEAQDTSLIRLNLIKIIYDNSNSIITAVGDDAQSIYRFSGCDISLFLNFNKYFPNTKLLFLKNTYRNSQELIDISTRFINKNPSQIPKNMISSLREKEPIKIIYYLNPKKVLNKLLNKLSDKEDIMILARNKEDIKEYLNKDVKYENNNIIFHNKSYKYLTIHSSKGLESNYVIILNVSNKKYGIPNKILDHPILNYITKEESFPYSEERRIFFVGITRCKIKTFLLVPYLNSSPFIKELF